jgi:hypothetical protein
VLLEAEGPPRIHGDHFIHAVAEEEAAIHDRDTRGLGRKPFAVEEYPAHSLEQQADVVPQAAEEAGQGHRALRHHRILAPGLAIHGQLERADLAAGGDRRNQGLRLTSWAATLSAMPRGTETTKSSAKPAPTRFCTPLNTLSCEIAWPLS